MTDFEEKVLKLLESINDKLDKLLGVEPTSVAPKKAEDKAISEPEDTVKPSEVVEKQKEEERMKEKPPIEGRVVCPECGGTAFKEQEDRSQILHQIGGIKIYKKLKICKNCGFTYE